MPTLTVTSWNACCDNGDPRNIEALIAKENPDILCLQEVSPAFMEHLQLPEIRDQYPHQTFAIDQHRTGYCGLGAKIVDYLVILSKIKFEKEKIRHRHRRVINRTLFGWFKGWHECIEHHGVDVHVGDCERLRILNLHIACADLFENKQRQFRRVAKHLNHNGPTVMCGDFNTTVSPELKHAIPYAIDQIGGPRVRDLLQAEELRTFARMVHELEMHDGFQDHVTHPEDGLSLDSILIPKEFAESSVHTMPSEMYGSDHPPLTVKLDLPD